MRAGQQLVQSGQLEAGRALLIDVLAAARVSVPQNRIVQGAALLARRLLVRRRATQNIQLAPYDNRQEQVVLEALWALSSSLALVDTVGAFYYETRFLCRALACGDTLSVARALFLEAIYAGIEGKAGEIRLGGLLAAAERACLESGEATTRSLLDLARGIVSWVAGDFLNCLRWATAAEELLTRHGRGFAFELGLIRAFALASQIWLGRFQDHAARFSVLLSDARERGDIQAESNLVLLAHAHVHFLVRDCPDAAEAAVQASLHHWPEQLQLSLQHIWALFSQAEIILYRGDVQTVKGLLDGRWSEIRRSTHMQLAPIRIWFTYLRTRIWLRSAVEARTARERRQTLRVAERGTTRLGREELPLARALAALCRGMLESVGGQHSVARAIFEEATEQFDNLGMQLFAQAARWAGAERIDEVAEVERAVSALGAVAPGKLLKLLVTVQNNRAH